MASGIHTLREIPVSSSEANVTSGCSKRLRNTGMFTVPIAKLVCKSRNYCSG